jgi:hypothetical protein
MTDQLVSRIDTAPLRAAIQEAAHLVRDAGEDVARGAQAVGSEARKAAVAVPVRIQVGRGKRRPALPTILVGIAAAAVGAFAAWALDPRLGRGRRAVAADRFAGGARRVARWSARRGRWLASTLAGLGERARHAAEPTVPLDEVALAHKVESILFRDPAIDKGDININAEGDVVFLRGIVADEAQARDIRARVERIEGVRDVVNLLRVRGEAPADVGLASLR